MFNKILNCAFQLTAKADRRAAGKLADQYVSLAGVQRFLNKRLDANEIARLSAFEGIVKSQINDKNKIDAAESRLEAAYHNGQM